MSIKKYYYNNQWLTYADLHNKYGFSENISSIVELKDSGNNPLSTYYNALDGYYIRDEELWTTTPELYNYYIPTDTYQELFKGNKLIAYFEVFKNSLGVKYFNYEFEWMSEDELKNRFGITKYHCIDYLMLDGQLLAWYDEETELYWDDRQGKKFWSSVAPVVEIGQAGTIYGEVNGKQLQHSNATLVESGSHVFGMMEKYVPVQDSITLDLYLRAGQNVTFGANDYWYSGLKSQEDVDKLVEFGDLLYNGGTGSIGLGSVKANFNNFNYFFIDILDVNGEHVSDPGNDPSNIYLYSYSGALGIHSNGTPITTLCNQWRVKIKKREIIILRTSVGGKENIQIDSTIISALYKDDDSGEQLKWRDTVNYVVRDYTWYANPYVGYATWQGEAAAQSTWQIIKGSDGNIKITGKTSTPTTIDLIKIELM